MVAARGPQATAGGEKNKNKYTKTLNILNKKCTKMVQINLIIFWYSIIFYLIFLAKKCKRVHI
ncbi:MAG: hypothetical protein U0X91_17715 [Spirosomataceae bacterium]